MRQLFAGADVGSPRDRKERMLERVTLLSFVSMPCWLVLLVIAVLEEATVFWCGQIAMIPNFGRAVFVV